MREYAHDLAFAIERLQTASVQIDIAISRIAPHGANAACSDLRKAQAVVDRELRILRAHLRRS